MAKAAPDTNVRDETQSPPTPVSRVPAVDPDAAVTIVLEAPSDTPAVDNGAGTFTRFDQ